ncbi:predicted protein [Arabidopsis lyrata subsp. lyrata]|uniref:Predicted protein n=1 Tax=Arabidopsis lyrata subsp. lyrata TaxID=81972 RepID=D7LE43_ARALL|nr:predicted protein [Arabidopsis lyrata subsp. lyrata]
MRYFRDTTSFTAFRRRCSYGSPASDLVFSLLIHSSPEESNLVSSQVCKVFPISSPLPFDVSRRLQIWLLFFSLPRDSTHPGDADVCCFLVISYRSSLPSLDLCDR